MGMAHDPHKYIYLNPGIDRKLSNCHVQGQKTRTSNCFDVFFLHYPIPSETQAYRDSKILEILLQLLFFTQNVLHLKGNA